MSFRESRSPLKQESFLWQLWKMLMHVLLDHCQWQRAHYLPKPAPFIRGQLFHALSKINSSYLSSPIPSVAFWSYGEKYYFLHSVQAWKSSFFNHYSCDMFSRLFTLLVVPHPDSFFVLNFIQGTTSEWDAPHTVRLEETSLLSYRRFAYLKEPAIILFFNHSIHPEPQWLRVYKLLFGGLRLDCLFLLVSVYSLGYFRSSSLRKSGMCKWN